MGKITCPDCGELVLYLGNHGCKRKAAPKPPEPKRGLPTTSGPKERKPEKPQIPDQPRRIIPLTVGDDRVIPLTVGGDIAKPSEMRPKWKGPLSTERVRRYRELHGEAAKKSHAEYMRAYRKHGPKGGSNE